MTIRDPAGPESRGRAGGRSRPTFSPWAIGSIVFSIVACPGSGLIGIALAMRARGDFRAHPDRRGVGLARAGLIIGIAATLAYVAGGWWWNGHIRRPIIEGPRAALEAGLRGDASGVRAEFYGPGAIADDEAVARYFEELTRRYGRLGSMRPDRTVPVDPASFSRREPEIAYTLAFERERVRLDARFIVADGSWLHLVGRWGRLRVIDADRGDLFYPAAAESKDPPGSADG